MARRKVVVTEIMEIKRDFPKSPFVGWGTRQKRKIHTVAESPRLLAYRACIASGMGGKEWNNLEQVQNAFRARAQECAREAASKPTVWKKGKKPKGFSHKY